MQDACRIITFVVTRRVFRTQNGHKCVDGQVSAPDPAGELTAELRGPEGKGKGGRGQWKRGRGENGGVGKM